jgi:uncharacterized protein YegP (UPF0339 family)
MNLARTPTLTLTAVLYLVALAARGDETKMTFEVYKDKGDEYRWRLRAGNGKILAVPEDAYKTHADAKRAAELVKEKAATFKVEFMEDKAKEHRWHLKALNGRVMARSSEGYKTKAGAEKAFETVKAGAKGATVTDVK